MAMSSALPTDTYAHFSQEQPPEDWAREWMKVFEWLGNDDTVEVATSGAKDGVRKEIFVFNRTLIDKLPQPGAKLKEPPREVKLNGENNLEAAA